jgi:hypothetical protein
MAVEFPTRAIATYATNEPQYATRSLLSRSRVDWAIEAEVVSL